MLFNDVEVNVKLITSLFSVHKLLNCGDNRNIFTFALMLYILYDVIVLKKVLLPCVNCTLDHQCYEI